MLLDLVMVYRYFLHYLYIYIFIIKMEAGKMLYLDLLIEGRRPLIITVIHSNRSLTLCQLYADSFGLTPTGVRLSW